MSEGSESSSGMELYHYTTAAGLQGILQKDGIHLWLTRYDCLNDPEEGKHALKFCYEVGDQLAAEGNIDPELWEIVRKLMEVGTYLPGSTPYVCCFSKNPDSLPMWRYYGKKDGKIGYNIGINDKFLFVPQSNLKTSKLLSLFENLNSIGSFYEVIYDDGEKKEKIREEFIQLNHYFIEQREKIAPENLHNFIASSSLFFRSYMTGYQACFKDHHFANEEEVRLVVFIPDNDDKIKIKHRVQDGYLVPYVELVIPKEQFDFLGITVSPLAEQELAESTTRSFLRSVGYPCEDEEGKSLIRRSNIPLRF